MIIIAGTIDITAEGDNLEQATAAAVEMMHATRQEAGCLRYAFSADLEDPARFHIVEHWESDEALKAHFAAPHMAAFQAALGGLGVRGTDVQRYDVSGVRPVFG